MFLDCGFGCSGMVYPTVQHTSYIVTWEWAVLTSPLAALDVALSFYCFSGAGFWYFFIAASRKALDARFFSAWLTLGRAILFSLSLAQGAHCVYLLEPKEVVCSSVGHLIHV